jgi:hypothetical protein
LGEGGLNLRGEGRGRMKGYRGVWRGLAVSRSGRGSLRKRRRVDYAHRGIWVVILVWRYSEITGKSDISAMSKTSENTLKI